MTKSILIQISFITLAQRLKSKLTQAINLLKRLGIATRSLSKGGDWPLSVFGKAGNGHSQLFERLGMATLSF